MAIPAVVAHGGAGAGPERLANVERAVAIAAGILDSGGSAIEAAVEACVVLEDDPVFNAGTGSVFRTDGSVHLDASIQTSEGKMGFVIGMQDTPNPIRVSGTSGRGHQRAQRGRGQDMGRLQRVRKVKCARQASLRRGHRHRRGPSQGQTRNHRLCH